MATRREMLQREVDRLRGELRERDRQAVEARMAHMAAEQAADDAKSVQMQAARDLLARETTRKGLWLQYLVGRQDPNARLDLHAINEAVEAAGDRWPPNVDPAKFNFTTTKPKQETLVEIDATHMGKKLASLKLIGE